MVGWRENPLSPSDHPTIRPIDRFTVIHYKLAYAVAAASANLVGALAVTTRARWSVRALDGMLAFAAGFMIAVGLLDLLPEALARGGHSAAVVALGGYLAV